MKYSEYLSQKEIDEMLSWYDNMGGLKFEGESKNEATGEEIKVWYPQHDDSKTPNFQKMMWKFNLSVEDSFAVFSEVELIKASKEVGEYKYVADLEVDDPKREVCKISLASSIKPAPLISAREFCVIQYNRWNDPNDHSKGFFQINKSVEHKDCPKQSGFVRGKRAYALICEPVEGKPNMCVNKIACWTGLEGWIPNAIIHHFLKKSAKSVWDDYKATTEKALLEWKKKNNK